MTITGLWWVLAGFASLIGLCIGSFLNVVVDRLPEDRSLVPGSACDTCGVAIPIWRNIPVLSYLELGGKCASCGAPIPAITPLVEALGGVLGFLAWARCVPVGPVDLPHAAAAFALLAFLSSLVASSLIDLRHRILPDELTIYAAPFALLAIAGLQYAGFHGFPFPSWQGGMLGAGVSAAFLASIGLVMTLVLRQNALGWGDVKLMLLVGGFVGLVPGAILVLLLASFLGSAIALVHLAITRRRSYLPLGPCIAWSAAIYTLYGDVLYAPVFPGIDFAHW